jgi:hypothetical protein
MFRTAIGLSYVAMLLAATGCQMCSHPYDHSGPVYSQDGCQSSGSLRAGSILGGNPQPSPMLAQTRVNNRLASAVPARSKTSRESASFGAASNWSPAGVSGGLKGQPQPGYVPGSERVISVTERVVKPAADSSQIAEDSLPESIEPMSSAGWTARRPTPEVLR